MSITIKCDEIESVQTGYFNEPALRIEIDEYFDLKDFITQIDEESVLDCIDDDAIASYLQQRGWSVNED